MSRSVCPWDAMSGCGGECEPCPPSEEDAVRLIDADALLALPDLDPQRETYAEWVRGLVDTAPTLRCGDCRNWSPYPVQEAFPPRRGTCANGVALEDGDCPAGAGCANFERRQP